MEHAGRKPESQIRRAPGCLMGLLGIKWKTGLHLVEGLDVSVHLCTMERILLSVPSSLGGVMRNEVIYEQCWWGRYTRPIREIGFNWVGS